MIKSAVLLPIIINNAMHAYDEEQENRKKKDDDYTDDEIIYMRERMTKPYDGYCHILPLDGTYTCNAHPYIEGENKYILTKENKIWKHFS